VGRPGHPHHPAPLHAHLGCAADPAANAVAAGGVAPLAASLARCAGGDGVADPPLPAAGPLAGPGRPGPAGDGIPAPHAGRDGADSAQRLEHGHPEPGLAVGRAGLRGDGRAGADSGPCPPCIGRGRPRACPKGATAGGATARVAPTGACPTFPGLLADAPSADRLAHLSAPAALHRPLPDLGRASLLSAGRSWLGGLKKNHEDTKTQKNKFSLCVFVSLWYYLLYLCPEPARAGHRSH
jgi:hypothetical protein